MNVEQEQQSACTARRRVIMHEYAERKMTHKKKRKHSEIKTDKSIKLINQLEQ